MLLYEVLGGESTVPYTLDVSHDTLRELSFTVNDQRYDVIVEISPASYFSSLFHDNSKSLYYQYETLFNKGILKARDKVATVEFSLTTELPKRKFGPKTSREFKLTGTGNQFAVISTVIRIMKDLQKSENIKGYFFTAKEPSKVKTYEHLIKRSGYKYIKGVYKGSVGFFVY